MSDAGATAIRTLGRVFARRYRLIEPLGRPASDQVFRARDGILARDVAVKTFHPDIPATVGYGWELLLTAMTARDPAVRPTAAEVAVLASELRETPEVFPAAEPVTDISPEPEPVPALRAVHLLRETATRRRRTALWTRVTHYR